MKRVMLALTGLSLLITPPLRAQNSDHPSEIEFNFKYQPGHTFTQRVMSRNVGAITMPPPLPEQKMSQMVEETIVCRCLAVNPDGSGEFEMKIDGLAMNMTIGNLKVKYDSRTYDPAAKTDWVSAMIARVFNAMNGLSFKMTLSPTGQLVKTEGLKEAFRKMADSIGDSKEAAMAKSMLEQMSSVDETTMGQEIQSFYRMVPSKPGPYRVGDKWDHSWKMTLPGLGVGLSGHGDYELIAIETFNGRPCAKIRTKESFDFSIPTSAPEAGAKKSPMAKLMEKMDINLRTSGGDGYAYVDYRTGLIVKVRGTQNFEMNMTMKPDAGGATSKSPVTQFAQSFRTSLELDLIEPGTQGTSPASTTKPAAGGDARR